MIYQCYEVRTGARKTIFGVVKYNSGQKVLFQVGHGEKTITAPCSLSVSSFTSIALSLLDQSTLLFLSKSLCDLHTVSSIIII